MKNLHISLTNVKNESRLFKEANSLIDHKIMSEIIVVGLYEEGLEKESSLKDKIKLDRLELKTRKLPKSMFFQVMKYIEFSLRVLFRYKNKSIDVVNIHSLALLPLGVMLKLFYDIKLIYDAHEYETERQGLRGIRKKLSKYLEKHLIRYCDKTIVVSESIAKEYIRLYPRLAQPAVVLNTPFLKNIQKRNLFRENLGIKDEQIIFLYQGVLAKGRGIEMLRETFKQFDMQENVIVFMGYGPLEDEIKRESRECENIYFHEAVSPDVLLDYTSSADFGISTIQNSCLSYYYCLPNKVFEYLMADIPVLVSNLPEISRFVRDNEVGVVVEEDTPLCLLEAIRKVKRLDKVEFRENIQKVKEVYNWEEQEKVLLQVYREIIC